MASVGTYWRTVRHLRARQIVGRAVFRLGARVPPVRSAPPARTVSGDWVLPARRESSLLSRYRFRFLNEERELDEVGWDSPSVAKLWRYNLHYFDDLNALDAEDREPEHAELIRRWIDGNPPAAGSAWEPYPTSLRVVNWIKWFQRGISQEPEWSASLAHQVRWLYRRVEWHLLGNHLFANAKALFIAGLYFTGEEADGWRRKGGRILARELAEQVLEDGGQFERSPMYHRLAVEDVLDLLAFLQRYGAPDKLSFRLRNSLRSCSKKMLSWATTMQFSDATLPRFNDSAEGIAPDAAELVRVADELGLPAAPMSKVPMHVLGASGYVRLAWDGALAFLDVAPVGPEYLPGHAHADTLSFELSVRGRLMIVNRGTSCYGASARRQYERSTAAHSTVELDSISSSEVWSGFRVGRRAYPRNLFIDEQSVACSHDGYRHLRGSPHHRRTWVMESDGLRVEDVVLGGMPAAVARFHLAPGLQASEVAGGTWIVLSDGREIARMRARAAWVRCVETLHALAFGRLVAAQTLELGLDQGRASTCWSW